MTTSARRRPVVAVVLAVGLGLAACTGADQASDSVAVDEGVAAAEAGGEEFAAGGDGATEAMEQDEAADGEQRAPAADGADVPDATANRDLIYRATIGLSSDAPDETVEGVEAAATAAGGFVSGTRLARDELDLLRGSITIRVPAENLGSLLDAVAATAAEVTSRDQTVEDVTGQVADIGARLRNLRALEEELLVLLTEAREEGDTDDVLAVFDRMGGVREEIEVLEGRQADLGNQVALSTVTVEVAPSPSLLASVESVPDDDLPLPWSPGNVVANAWDATVAALQAFVDTAIRGVVFVLPVLLVWLSPLLLVLAAAWWWRRRRAHGDAGGPLAGTPPPTDPTPDGGELTDPDGRTPVPVGAGGGRDQGADDDGT